MATRTAGSAGGDRKTHGRKTAGRPVPDPTSGSRHQSSRERPAGLDQGGQVVVDQAAVGDPDGGKVSAEHGLLAARKALYVA